MIFKDFRQNSRGFGGRGGKKGKKNGASDRNRTGDNHVGNVMLYQLSYTRIKKTWLNITRFLYFFK